MYMLHYLSMFQLVRTLVWTPFGPTVRVPQSGTKSGDSSNFPSILLSLRPVLDLLVKTDRKRFRKEE